MKNSSRFEENTDGRSLISCFFDHAPEEFQLAQIPVEYRPGEKAFWFSITVRRQF
jgi:hypothetical protein